MPPGGLPPLNDWSLFNPVGSCRPSTGGINHSERNGTTGVVLVKRTTSSPTGRPVGRLAHSHHRRNN
jgi:hypothetical protein